MGHRPTTRSKNKRRRPEDDADTTPQILRKIHYSGEVTKDDFKHLYMIWKPVCQGCRVNTKDNPNCFCGLVPHPNGNRKSGLWQKQSEIIHSLGPDPCNDIRASHDSPAGLTNLGATCYANSILQCLYMNKSFCEGVFSIEPDLLKRHPVLNQLARLFAQLHVSKMASVDSASFIETLKLDNAIQQDSHEFLTLLLSLLERCLRDSKVSKARTVVQDLFRGSVSHVTRCSKCGKDSAASSNIEDFYDLELNVKGLKSLDESLNDYLSMEELNGENQYFCDSCNTRVDATRYIKLRTLPDVLNFQLKRYIFLPKTAEKKKITSAFCFPAELVMGQRMHEPSQSELIYDLSAVLLHKGTAVNSGHYIAHIKDENSGQWWKFDDEDVSNLGCHPLGEASSISTTKSVQNESSAHLSCTEPRSTDVVGNNINASEPPTLQSNDIKNAETFSSCDAYMLRYNIRQRKTCDKTNTDCGGETMEIEDNVVSPNNNVACPSYLSEGVMELNASYIASCEEYKLKKERKLKHVTERRQEVRFVLSEAPVLSQGDPYFWISTDWLREWADSISICAIDNTSIQCLHGKVPVSKVGSMKRLSCKAWTLLHSKHGGGPELSNDDYCSSCLIDGANSIISADSYREKRTIMKELAEAALAGNTFDGTLYYVSRPWLQQWVRRKNIDSPCEADAGPTGSIRCLHGDLLPERAVGARNHVLVPENLWLFFYERANAVKPDDSRGCWAFPSDSRPCAQCSVEYQEAASLEVSLRTVKLKQRQNHEKLAQGKGIALSSNCRYYLLPSLWLSNWRSYVNATGKNASLSVEPDPLGIVINSLKCEEHSLLLERPLDLTYKRGSIFQRVSTTDGLTIITESDWKLFCKEWGGTEEKGIYAEIEYTNGLTSNLVSSCEEFPILDGHLSPDGPTDGNESKQLVIKTTPEICEDCIGEKERCELKRKQNYCNECIRVCFVRGKNAPKSVIEASGTSDLDRRTSKRSRKTNFGNSVNLEVSGFTTIYQLKLMIWESFGVIKENQVLCKGSAPIAGEEAATLADMNIFPGDTLWVTDSEIHEHRDIAEELLNHNLDVQQTGEGFQGTLLTSNASSVVA